MNMPNDSELTQNHRYECIPILSKYTRTSSPESLPEDAIQKSGHLFQILVISIINDWIRLGVYKSPKKELGGLLNLHKREFT
jgi:hypothetical protein